MNNQSHKVRKNFGHWAVAGILGIFIGFYLITISSFSAKNAYYFIMPLMFLFLMMFFKDVRKLLLAIILIEFSFPFDVYLFYREDIAGMSTVGGMNISITTICLTILYVKWIANILTKTNKPPYTSFRLTLPLVVYLGLVSASALVAMDMTLAIFKIFLLLQMFMLYVYIVGTVQSQEDVIFIMKMLAIGIILESLFMILLRVSGQSINIGIIPGRLDQTSFGSGARVGGALGGPNSAAAYFSLLLVPTIGILLSRLNRSYKTIALIAFSFGLIALFLTLSRGGWLAFGLSLGLFCLFAWIRGLLQLKVLIFLFVIFVSVIFIFQDAVVYRLFGDDAGSAFSRIPLMKVAFEMIQDNPLLGVGVNNFAITMKQYINTKYGWITAVHNHYLMVWAETGFFALVAFMWFLLVHIRRGWQLWSTRDYLLAPLALGFIVAIIGHMGHMTVDVFNDRQHQLLWLIASLITAMQITQKKDLAISEN